MRGVGMWTGTRSLTVLLACCVVGLVSSPTGASGEGLSSPVGSGSTSLVGSPLVVGGVQSLDEGQQIVAAEEAARSNPTAVADREASRTEFEDLNDEQARHEAGSAFPAMVARQDGGPPQLPVGQKLTALIDANAAQIDIGNGEGVVVELTVPMATETASHTWTAVNLGLHVSGDGFEPDNPLVGVRIPKHLPEGAQLPSLGVSLTPVDSRGAPLAGAEGESNGATVDYANTQTDSDTILKPSNTGLDASVLLRSVDSPQQFYYRVDLAPGESLTEAPGESGALRVVQGGATVGEIMPPEATDAVGTSVPAAMALSGGRLIVTVDHRSGSYEYPISVNPEFSEITATFNPGSWTFYQGGGYSSGKGGEELWMSHSGAYGLNDYGEWGEWTQGYTKIYALKGKVSVTPEESKPLSSWLEIFKTGMELHVTSANKSGEYEACANSGCTPEVVAGENAARFGITTVESGSASFKASMTGITTYIGQPKGEHAKVSYNSLSNVDGTDNVLAGGGSWLGPSSGAFEYTAEDGGLGVSEVGVQLYREGAWGTENWQQYGRQEYLKGTSCVGIECAATENLTETYSNLTGNGGFNLPEGEYLMRATARSAMPGSPAWEHGEGERILKVDATPPHGIAISGLEGKGEEYELGEVTKKLKIEASDGEGVIKSSGIKSIAAEVDQRQIGASGGYCTPGPCTANDEWAINGAELGTGTHVLTVVVTDNAGNIATKKYSLTVYHASPVAIGSGSVNPESGDFALEATDVDLSGGTGSLVVTRHYDSLNPKEGTGGPIGPQWTVSLGSLASLEELPDKSVMVVGPEGLTHFSVKSGGGFEAPTGDTTLTLEYQSEYEYKEPAYLLKNSKQDTTTVFTLPKGSPAWMPTASKGPIATSTMTDSYATVETEGKTIVQPTLELAPHSTASCPAGEPTKWEKACRGLEFVYGKETKAKGEGPTGWGEYKNDLKEVIAVAYNHSSKETKPVPVAAYEYDSKGRLRAKWDPRVSPALKTTYGYDAEGHVTAVTAPGQQSWILTYGTISGDISSGRLLKVSRVQPPAGASEEEAKSKLAEQTNPVTNTETPVVTGSPLVGTRMAVSNGKWTHSPAAYGYQWEDCSLIGPTCFPILGATNPNYVPQRSDLGYYIAAEVTATNGNGSLTVSAAQSSRSGTR